MAETPKLLAVGTTAPAFSLQNQDGELVSLKDFRGKKVVIYFYPQDATPTCTKQACNLKDNHQMLLDAGYVVLGISPDPVKSHQKFAEKYGLPFTLLSDEKRKVIEKYGVWGLKTLYGRDYMGVFRTTYVVNEKGKIAHVLFPVVSGDHANQILAAGK
jgi:thioredoxin-dependent peroxiredoxin